MTKGSTRRIGGQQGGDDLVGVPTNRSDRATEQVRGAVPQVEVAQERTVEEDCTVELRTLKERAEQPPISRNPPPNTGCRANEAL